MAQKHPNNINNKKQGAEKQSITKTDNFNIKNFPLIPFLTLTAYLAVHFIPELGGIDVMGVQWLYISVLDLLVVGYILANRSKYLESLKDLFKNAYIKLYLSLYLFAGLSILFAINQVEAWVCYVRFTATVVAFFNIGILFGNHMGLFRAIARLLALILLIESIQYLSRFFDQLSTVPLGDLINRLNGNTGNKNIFAASLAIKIPFVLYCLVGARIGERIFLLASLTLGISIIFMTSARASFVSTFLISLCFILFCIVKFLRNKQTELLLYRLAYILVPLLAGFFLAQGIFQQAGLYQDRNSSSYADITGRISSISLTEDNSSYRLALWKHALTYIGDHPIMGAGYGNWKLASIPYVKEDINDLNVPAHAHNDFLEHFAELGIVGGLLFISLFVCLAFFTLRAWRMKQVDEEVKLISLFSFLALLVYAVDAGLNFPIERPIMQVFFACVTAFNLGAYLKARRQQKQAEAASTAATGGNLAHSLYGLITILIMIPATYVSYLTYQSLRAQMKVIPDMKNEPMLLPLSEVTNLFPPIPNLTTSSQPIEAILGRYYSENKRFDEAKVMLRNAIPYNPYIYYSHFLMANIFFQTNQMDSARYYAGEAYYHRPRANTYYQTYMAVLAKAKDTAEIHKVFNTYVGYRNEPFAWNMYLLAMLNAEGKGTKEQLVLADSALNLFKPKPGAQPVKEYADLEKRKQEILNNMQVGSSPAGITQEMLNQAMAIYNEGVAAFSKQDFATAAARFVKAGSIAVFNYSIYENAGVSYFNLKQYRKAVSYFDKVISMNVTTDGKSEYFKGVALLNLGEKQPACAVLQIARSKGYPDAANIIANYCQ